jgi:hypothetical protein
MICPSCFVDIERAKHAVTLPDYWASNMNCALASLFRHGTECGDTKTLLFLLGVAFARRRQRFAAEIADGPPVMATRQN